MEPLEEHLGPLNGHLRPLDGHLRPLDGHLGPFSGHLGPFNGHLGPFGGDLALGPLGRHLNFGITILGPLTAIWGLWIATFTIKRDAQRQYVVIGTLAPILLNFY